jgi:hypothetical protein
MRMVGREIREWLDGVVLTVNESFAVRDEQGRELPVLVSVRRADGDERLDEESHSQKLVVRGWVREVRPLPRGAAVGSGKSAHEATADSRSHRHG